MLKVNAEETTYAHSDTAESGNVVLNVEWNEPVLWAATYFSRVCNRGKRSI